MPVQTPSQTRALKAIEDEILKHKLTADFLETADLFVYDFNNWPDTVSVAPDHFLPMNDVNTFIRMIEFDKIFSPLYYKYSAHKKVNLTFYVRIDLGGGLVEPTLIPVYSIPLDPQNTNPFPSFKDITCARFNWEFEMLECYFPKHEQYKIVGIDKLMIFQQLSDL